MDIRILALAAALFVAPSPVLARLAPAEQTMIRTIDAEQARTLSMLERWVGQNSGTMNRAGVAAVGQMLRAELEPLGFKVQWVDMASAGRSGHLIARHAGNKRGKRLLLIGHLDTVFEADSPFQQWKRDGDRANGPGAADDKGGVAVMIAALRAMQAAGTLRAANITVVLTGDEEDAGNPLDISRRDLVAEGKRADAALDFEGLVRQNGLDMGSIARRSVGSWTVTVSAGSGHSSGVGVGGNGFGANYELARILDQFRRDVPEDKLTFNVGLISGGERIKVDDGKIRIEAAGKSNIIAASAFARGDIRAISIEQLDRAQAKMRAIVAQPLRGAKSEISFDPDFYPPMPPTQGNRALLARLNEVNADLGVPPMAELDAAKRGGGDISFVAADVDGLIGFGPSSSGDHTPSETVDIPSIFTQAKRAAIFMSRQTSQPRVKDSRP